MKNKYTSTFDKKVDLVLSRYREGKISESVVKIVLGHLIQKYLADDFSTLLSSQDNEGTTSLTVNLKKITEYYKSA